jgi:hypothetical protein
MKGENRDIDRDKIEIEMIGGKSLHPPVGKINLFSKRKQKKKKEKEETKEERKN